MPPHGPGSHKPDRQTPTNRRPRGAPTRHGQALTRRPPGGRGLCPADQRLPASASASCLGAAPRAVGTRGRAQGAESHSAGRTAFRPTPSRPTPSRPTSSRPTSSGLRSCPAPHAARAGFPQRGGRGNPCNSPSVMGAAGAKTEPCCSHGPGRHLPHLSHLDAPQQAPPSGFSARAPPRPPSRPRPGRLRSAGARGDLTGQDTGGRRLPTLWRRPRFRHQLAVGHGTPASRVCLISKRKRLGRATVVRNRAGLRRCSLCAGTRVGPSDARPARTETLEPLQGRITAPARAGLVSRLLPANPEVKATRLCACGSKAKGST